MPDWRRTETGLTAAIVCLVFTQHVFAQDVDPRCKDIFDKVACTCAVRNGGRVIPLPVGIKREGLKLRPKEEAGDTQTLDGGRVAFPKYYRREGLKIRRSHALEGYLACMHAAGRK
jgi:hypothetical protein